MATARRTRLPQAAARSVAREEEVSGRMRSSATVSSKKEGVTYEDDTEEDILLERFSSDDPPAYVKVSGGMTHNLQQYEFLRLDVSVSIPCKRSRLEEAYEFASQMVSDKIGEEQTKWLGASEQIETSKKRGRGQ